MARRNQNKLVAAIAGDEDASDKEFVVHTLKLIADKSLVKSSYIINQSSKKPWKLSALKI